MNEKLYEMNKEYLSIINSKQYRIGKLIFEIKDSLSSLKSFKNFIFLNYRRIRIRKYKKKSIRFKTIDDKCMNTKKIAVYTAIFGAYDKIIDPVFVDKSIDYFIFTDLEISDDKIWKKIDLKGSMSILNGMNNVEKNRYFKMLGYKYFLDYDYIIYIDGNLEIYGDITKLVKYTDEITGLAMFNHSERDCIYDEAKVCEILKKGNYKNIKEEINQYFKENMPRHYGMCECNVIIKDMHNELSNSIMKLWWRNFIDGKSKRDQISFPYTLWKMNLQIHQIGCLGENMNMDPIFRRKVHILK